MSLHYTVQQICLLVSSKSTQYPGCIVFSPTGCGAKCASQVLPEAGCATQHFGIDLLIAIKLCIGFPLGDDVCGCGMLC